jgi:murein DD-endopeptidase MepM/ murein hydrolase activator NlpD
VKYLVSAIIAIVITGVGFLLFRSQPAEAPLINIDDTTIDVEIETNASEVAGEKATSSFTTASVAGLDTNISFNALIPTGWQAEAVSSSEALSIFDPAAPGDTSLEQSRIFVKYFKASSFLTLTTVNILSQAELTISDRLAVTYVIEKKNGANNFAAQPTWRNLEHRVTDIRSTNASPTTYFVFAKAPGVSDAVFDTFLNSVQFTLETSAVEFPMDDFYDRITKKHFGQFITPANSPIQPERFSGYHTAVDLETTEVEQDTDVPVLAIADGLIKRATTAAGYGGLLVIEHTVNDEMTTAVYGHVRLSSSAKGPSDTVAKGERIAFLGTGGTSETDGERMHLHFGLLKGTSLNIRGYVSAESELSAWYDPEEWFVQFL